MATYMAVLWRILKFIVARHPCLSAGFFVWWLGSLYVGATSSWALGIGMIVFSILATALIRGIWNFLDCFGSNSAKTKRKLQKQRNRELLMKYISEGKR